MKLIPLTKDQFAKVDDEDFERFGHLKWFASYSDETESFYAYRKSRTAEGRQTTVSLHRSIVGNPSGKKVDHRNHDTLDCQRHNLRICTNSQNMANRNGIASNNTSGFRGVGWDKRWKKWKVRVMVNKKMICVGAFTRIEDADKAARAARLKYFGEFA